MIDLTERIANQIADIFPDYTIYSENQASGFNVPSFYIARTTTRVTPRLNEIQDRLYGYEIVFFAENNVQIEKVSESLLNSFTEIKNYASIRNKELVQNTDEKTVILTFDVFIRAAKQNNNILQERMDLNAKSKKA
ncbi:phage tail terminator family protein [Lactobacillus sp. PV034]|uniref:phage tail terminator family protein n=1 Tax=Lactobacillus sp. PV034 TaxID=2594495 RepID=UPI0022401E57|nr:hypothetical protein [Lactobacillus sp. PV034]QNQ80784.1 hypothetical protein FP432_04060 [Lactobacillus sp. PV034]